MFQFFSSTATYLFPAGRAVKLGKTGVKITNSTNPLTLTKNITLTVIDYCAPPPVRLVFHCAGVAAKINTSIAIPNPVTVGSSIALISQVYENC